MRKFKSWPSGESFTDFICSSNSAAPASQSTSSRQAIQPPTRFWLEFDNLEVRFSTIDANAPTEAEKKVREEITESFPKLHSSHQPGAPHDEAQLTWDDAYRVES
jgi:hypothetical protein